MAIITPHVPITKDATAGASKPESEQINLSEASQSGITEVTAPKEEALSPKFAALARKEKALRAQAQAVKAREEALKASESSYSDKFIPKDALSKEKVLETLAANGLSYDDLTQLILSGSQNQDPELYKLKQEIKALKDAQDSTKNSMADSQKRAYEQAITQIKNETKLLVDSNEAFETIKETNNHEAVVELIKETFDKDGTLLTVEEAATQVEAYLMENALKMAQLRKIKAKLNPPAEETKPQETQKQQPTQMKTLTNAVSASTPGRLTDKQRRERALLAFHGKLT